MTPAHAAVALPVAALLPRLSLLALMVGTQVPDLPMFFPRLTPGYAVTHSYGWGMLANVAYGLLLVGVCVWVGPAALPLLPAPLRRRLAHEPTRFDAWTLIALWLGAVSHVLWDELTHEGRWGARHLQVLRSEWVLGLPGYKVMQYASSVLGMLFLAAWSLRTYRRRPEAADVARPWREPVRWCLLLTVVLVVPTLCIAWALVSTSALDERVFVLITRALAAELVLALVVRALFAVSALREEL